MEDALNLASANGFILGLLVATELYDRPSASILDNESAVLDLILTVADGTKSIALEDVRLLKMLSASADATKAREAMQKTAMRLLEWYRREFLT